jgi:hypothetical protein
VALSVQGIGQLTSPLAALEDGQYGVFVHQPLIDIPAADAQIILSNGPLTSEGAKQLIELWLSSKSDAFGEKHQIESFNRILGDSLLSLWSDRAAKLKQTQTYWNYQHKVEIKSLKTSQNKPNQATVEANVQELAKSYKNGQLGRSYDDNLRVRYDLIREKDRWLIQDIQVIP